MTEPSSIKISEVVGAISHLIFTKTQSDSALLDKEATKKCVAQSGERYGQAAVECANILEAYVAQAVQQELQKILALTNQKL